MCFWTRLIREISRVRKEPSESEGGSPTPPRLPPPPSATRTSFRTTASLETSVTPRSPRHGRPSLRRGLATPRGRRRVGSGSPTSVPRERRVAPRDSGTGTSRGSGSAPPKHQPLGTATPNVTPPSAGRPGSLSLGASPRRSGAPAAGRGIYITVRSRPSSGAAPASSDLGSGRAATPSPGRAASGGTEPVSPSPTSAISSHRRLPS